MSRGVKPYMVCFLFLLPLTNRAPGATTGTEATTGTVDLSVLKETPGQRDKRMAWWREAKFGMFVHWGLYAIPAGVWNGQEVPGGGEWIMNQAKIPVEEYEKLVPQFNPVKFDARQWVRIAKDAGMKYIVITSKHHDGFCMFNSALTDYDIMSAPFRRDPMKELAAACKEEGIRLCFYHSILDWHSPDQKTDFPKFKDYLFGQVRELLTNYGPIGTLWFDGDWIKPWTAEMGLQLQALCRTLQPGIIVNDRVGKRKSGDGDFATPEQKIPAAAMAGRDWETCMTMNGTWGYKKNDQNWKSAEDLIRKLVDIAGKGGNFLLNVGPTAEGLIPDPSVDRLKAMGRWMRVNGESVHGAQASPFPQTPWGRCTAKPGRLYLHVFDWPAGRLEVPGLRNPVKKAYILSDVDHAALKVSSGNEGVAVEIPAAAPDRIDTVVVLEIEGSPDVGAAPPAGQGPEGAVEPRAAELNCRLSAPSVAAYGRIEIAFPDPFQADNPDDPRQADVEGIFVSPSGREWRLPAFLYKDFERQGDAIVPRGQPEWRVRFTPTEPGRWKASVRATAGGKTYAAEAGSFDVQPAKARGFLRRSKANPLALEFENGEPLIAIGSNVFPQTKLGKPVGAERAANTIRYLERTAAAGGTFCRLRMDSWFIPLELPADKATGYRGLGRYDPQAAWEVDQIVEAAERLGIALMLCVENANANVNETPREDRAGYNGYAKENGGTLEDMKDFWTDAEAARLFSQKMRYCVGRWGYSPAIGVWEFFNEVALKPDRAEAIAVWHDRMSKAWRDMDPYARPIATSPVGGFKDEEDWWRLFEAPTIDLIQYHTYSFTDLAHGIGSTNLEIAKRARKPLIVGEFGSSKRLREETPGGKGSDPKIDPKGLHLHNGIWAGTMTGAAGALPWFITNYIDPLNLYPMYTGLSRFAKDWKINEGPWRPIEARAKAVDEGAAEEKWQALDLPVKESLSKPPTDVYIVGRDGSLGGARDVNGFLFGVKSHADLRRPPTFQVDYPAPGQFIVTVQYVIGKADTATTVSIHLDGNQAALKKFPVGEGQGKKAVHIAQYDNWRVTYDEPIAVSVPAGPHAIKVDAGGTDRTSVAYRLTNYVEGGLSTYRVYAMGWKGSIRLWVQNAQNTYYNHYMGKPPTCAPKAEIRVAVESPGRYEAEWWDTVKGAPLRTETAESKDGYLTLHFPGTLADEACKARRVE